MATGGCGNEDIAPVPSSSRPQEERLRREGYNCEFVERPPKAVQCECPICLLVLREPHQITCCGYSFCGACVKHVQADNKCCPTCNEIDYTVFPDKRLKRSLNDFHVYCSNKEEGCEWAGELGELDRHLNLQPPSEKRFVGCLFSEVDCSFCSHPFQRRYVQTHQSEDCPSRPYSCQHCNEYSATFDDVTAKHWPLCAFFPLSCPNSCELVLQRREIENHVKKECPLTSIDCDFHMVGCKAQLPRKDMPRHTSCDLAPHLSLLQMHVVTHPEDTASLMPLLIGSMQRIVIDNEALRRQNAALKTSVGQVEASSRDHQETLEELTYTGTLPVEFTMSDFEEHKANNDEWFSPPFYTHTHGYKLCIKVDANGLHVNCGKGTHVSIYLRLMRGEYDDDLQWPFQGSVSLQLLNQLEDRKHHSGILDAYKCTPELIKRVVDKERAQLGPGLPEFIAHTELVVKNCQYLKNNQLRIRVCQATNLSRKLCIDKEYQNVLSLAATVEERVCLVPIEFTIRNFKQHKDKNLWHSHAFYTQKEGYRFCVEIYPNGYGSHKGSHMSLYTSIMRGPFDAKLKWPFEGSITIQVLNQVEDKNHLEKIIDYTEQTDGSCNSRAIDAEISAGWGYGKLLPHDSLGNNAAKNTQYLVHDTLRIRILKIEIK